MIPFGLQILYTGIIFFNIFMGVGLLWDVYCRWKDHTGDLEWHRYIFIIALFTIILPMTGYGLYEIMRKIWFV